MSTELVKAPRQLSLGEIERLGDIFVKSGLFQDIHGQAQAMVKILAGQELGFGPFASMKGIDIIKGKVALGSNLIAAKIKMSGRYDFDILEHTDTGCSIAFTKRMPDGSWKSCGPPSTFYEEDARTAKLIGGDSYQKYPRNMYFARALTNGARFYCADVFHGHVYTPEELGAVVDGETGEVITLPSETVSNGAPEQPEWPKNFQCPKCQQHAIMRSQFTKAGEKEPGWYCNKRNKGCNSSFPFDTPAILVQTEHGIESPILPPVVPEGQVPAVIIEEPTKEDYGFDKPEPKRPRAKKPEVAVETLFEKPAETDLRARLITEVFRIGKTLNATPEDFQAWGRTYEAQDYALCDLSKLKELVNYLRARTGQPKWSEEVEP